MPFKNIGSKTTHGFWPLLLRNQYQQLDASIAYRDPEGSKWQFKNHYQQHVLPHVQNFEDKRCVTLQKFRERMFIVILGGLLVLALALYWASTMRKVDDGPFILVFLGCSALYWWGTLPLRRYQKRVKQNIFPHIFSFFGEAFSYNLHCPIKMADLKVSGLIPSHDSANQEDYIKGHYKGVDLELFEATLREKRGSGKNRRNVVVFQGIFLTFTMNKSFKGQTIVQKDRNAVFNWLESKFDKGKYQQVTLEDTEFEDIFDVKATDQVEARYLLTTSFMERLKKLGEIIHAQHIECSFYDKKVLFKISSSKNRFEVHDLYKPATFQEDIHHILEEMHIIFEMIEHLKLHEQTRL